jgi:hypothetical protein
MYGVPADLDLAMFVGAKLTQLGVGEFQLQFNFMAPVESRWGPGPSIGVEGKWELRDGAGELVDRSMSNAEREVYRVHVILGHDVVATNLDAPHSFSLRFDDGHELTVFDDSKQYESFSIQPGDIFV